MEEPKKYFEQIWVEVDPEKIDESVRSLAEQVRSFVVQGRHTKVRIKYKGKALMPDIPLGVFLATEAITFWYAGLLRALVVNLGARTMIEVQFIHNIAEKVKEGQQLYMEGEIVAAEECYREALSMRADDTAGNYHLGVLLRVTGKREEAIECFERAARNSDSPEGKKAAEALERIRRGKKTL